MKGNKIYIGLGALILVILVIMLSEKLGNMKPSDKTTKFFSTVTEKTIGSVVIIDGMDSVRILKKGDVWFVKSERKASGAAVSGSAGMPVGTSAADQVTREYPADSASIASVLEKITAMKKETEVSQNPEKQALFEVDSIKGTFVEVFDENAKSLGSLRIGKSGADFNSHYVRQIGSNTVYAVDGGIRYAFFSEEKRWRDKNIIRFDRKNAKSITLLKKDGTTIVLAKAAVTSSAWSITAPISAPVKADQIDELLNKLSFFTATDFQDTLLTDTITGFNTPELVVSVNLGGDVSKKVVIGKQKGESKNFWVKTDSKAIVYLVSDTDILALDKSVDGLKAMPTVSADAPQGIPAAPIATPSSSAQKK